MLMLTCKDAGKRWNMGLSSFTSGWLGIEFERIELPINYIESTWEQRRAARNEYIRIQGGKCCHCGEPLSGDPRADIMILEITEELFPPDFFRWPVHLHHSHYSGMTIGACHAKCNAVLWEYHGE